MAKEKKTPEFKRTITTNGKYKDLQIVDGEIVNKDGEIIDLAQELEEYYGANLFELSTSLRQVEDLSE